MIFLVSPISGRDAVPALWNRLLEINQIVPIVTFYRAAFVLKRNHIANKIFNITTIGEEEGYLRDVIFEDKILAKGIKYCSAKDPISGQNSANDSDHFVLVDPMKGRSVRSLMTYRGNVVASQSGLNIFVGQKGAAVPREDLALEFDRPVYFLKLLDNLLKKSPVGYARLKLGNWPVVLRMDDPPTTWELVARKNRILQPVDYVRIIDTIARHRAKLTCFVTPAYISKHGELHSWTAADFDYAKAILSILANGMNKGIIEIGSHGLTHLTINYRPPSGIKSLLCRVGLFEHGLASEFYDSMVRKEIPYRLQKEQIGKSIKLIEEIFGLKPKVFAPPAHVWDNSTEKAVTRLGIPYFSADMNFYFYPEGCSFRKNPSPLGEMASKKGLLYVSATIVGTYGTFDGTLKLFNQMGIPLVWQQHNFHPSWFTSSTLECFFKDLQQASNKSYMTISELGALLRKYIKVKSSVILEKGRAVGRIETEIPIVIETYQRGRTQERKIAIGCHELDLTLD
jgi:peptidoglycan/xylan/chitin deacetylase (PgdA/CDA1 family)